jgi:hypothetical protein
MTKDDISRMAREAGMHDPMIFIAAYERFAKLVAKHEREKCAKVCEGVNGSAQWFAKQIRARGNT